MSDSNYNNGENRSINRAYSVFRKEESPMHYNIRILKLQPTKVMINGRIKDRTSLSANERDAVKAHEDIEIAKEKLRKQRQDNSV